MTYTKLLEKAKSVSDNAYSPYSNFCVGAALLTKDGNIYTGCNVENHGIQSVCGERVAFTKALSEGQPSDKRDNYVAIMVVGHKRGEEKYVKTLPCGYCRQFMSEFVNPEFKILTFDGKEILEFTIAELLPSGFEI